MKNYSIGLITGILLTASALMFMGAKQYSRYDIDDVMSKVKNIESTVEDIHSNLSYGFYYSIDCN